MMDTVLVLRTCDKDLKSWGGFQWPSSGPVECPDWLPTPVCSNGLFGLLWGTGNLGYLDRSPGSRWLVVEVEAESVVRIDCDKVKYPRGNVVHCGDRRSALDYLDEHGGASIVGLGSVGNGRMASPAFRLLKHVWSHQGDASGKDSWRSKNSSMQSALRLAIETGMRFGLDDFAEIQRTFNATFWMGVDGGYGESYYAAACRSGNRSACLSFEAWKKRKPFIVDGQRVYAGLQFEWNKERVTCTSFADDGTYFVACTYKKPPKDEGYSPRKVDRVLKVGHKDIKAAKPPKVPAKAAS